MKGHIIREDILEIVGGWDRQLLFLIHDRWTSQLLDPIMIVASSPWPWLIGLVILGRLALKTNGPNPWQTLALCAIGIATTDVITAYGLKPFFARLRPCKVFFDIELISGCAGWFGFPSNHAANSMCMAMILCLQYKSWIRFVPLLVALLIGYSRIYLGVHYPADVLGGFVVGAMLGYLTHLTVPKISCFRKLQFTSEIKK